MTPARSNIKVTTFLRRRRISIIDNRDTADITKIGVYNGVTK